MKRGRSKRVWQFAGALLLCAAGSGSLAGQSTLVVDSVSSAGLRANVVGDSPVRKVLVYLPPSYRREPTRRYPVLYLLHGATSTPEEWLNGVYQGMNLQATLDSLIATAAAPEFIVAMPDANNALGADWYTNSPVTGNWQDFVVRDLVGHVDRRYRTDAKRSRRALVGHSMGGFGALAIGFEHPNVCGLIYAISPCCIGFVGRLAPSAPTWPALSAVTGWKSAVDQLGLVVGMAAAFDGNTSDPRLVSELPFELRNGAVVQNPTARHGGWQRCRPTLHRRWCGEERTLRRSISRQDRRRRRFWKEYNFSAAGSTAFTFRTRTPCSSEGTSIASGSASRSRCCLTLAAGSKQAGRWTVNAPVTGLP